jgi:hypothetical protein
MMNIVRSEQKEIGSQRAEDRGRRTVDGGQRTEGRGRRAAVIGYLSNPEHFSYTSLANC